MEKFSPKSPEKKELPKDIDLIADFVRHGKPKYTEDEEYSGQLEGILTDEGKEHAKNAALELADKIDMDKEVVVIWASKKNRAQQTAAIIHETFQEKGIPMMTNAKGEDRGVKTRSSLRDMKTGANDPENPKEGSPFWDTIFYANEKGEKLKSGEDVGFDRWLEFWVEKEEEGKLPEKTETTAEFKKRSMRVLTYLEKISSKIKPEDGKRLRFIVVGHEEGVRDILEEAYGVGTEKGTGPGYAEIVEVGIASGDNNARLDISYKGQEQSLTFDRKNRSISKIED